MQEHDRSIFDAKPPFLVLYANRHWRLAIEIRPHPQGVSIIEPFADHDSEEPVIIPGSAWHVGENVWEFDYATQIMTLDHPTYHVHPAWQLWLYWLSCSQQREAPGLH